MFAPHAHSAQSATSTCAAIVGDPTLREAGSGTVQGPEAGTKLASGLPTQTGKAPTIIQFGAAVYFAAEDEGKATVDVLRLGDASAASTVEFTTVDASARSGIKYVSQNGTLSFGAGECSKLLEVKVLSDNRWDATLEFGMVLSSPTQAVLSESLSHCRVKILDSDAFPTNRHKEVYKNSGLGEIPKVQLFLEYVKMCFRDPRIKHASFYTVVCDQAQNLRIVSFLMIKLYLIDVVLVEDGNEALLLGLSKQLLLLIICLAVFLPQSASSFIAVKRVGLRVGGMCRFKLQSNLLRKFLITMRISDRQCTPVNSL